MSVITRGLQSFRFRALFVLLLSVSSAIADPRFERASGTCEAADSAFSAKERKSACDLVITAGPSAGGQKQVVSVRRGEFLYVLAFRNRARAYNGLGDYESAVRDMNKYFEVRGNPAKPEFALLNPWDYQLRAISYYGLGRYNEALSDLATSADACVKNFLGTACDAWASDLRGDIAMATKDYKLALESYEKFSRAHPDKPGFAEKIALARRMLENPSSAPTPPSLPSPSPPTSPACKMYPNLC